MTDDPARNNKGKKTKQGFDIGKGKPPKEFQFPPGVSGNPSGRPKRPPKISKAMSEILNRDITLTVNGQKKTMSTQDALLLSLATKAIKGSVKDQLGVINLIRDLEAQQPLYLNSLFDED